jgi:predicted small secreted protein
MKAASLLVLAALFLSACNTFEGIGRDIQKGGEAIERAADKASK